MWRDMLRAFWYRRMEPRWDPIFDPEWSRVKDALEEGIRSGRFRLEIVRLGPDQYVAFYENFWRPNQPISVAIDPIEAALLRTPAPQHGAADDGGA